MKVLVLAATVLASCCATVLADDHHEHDHGYKIVSTPIHTPTPTPHYDHHKKDHEEHKDHHDDFDYHKYEDRDDYYDHDGKKFGFPIVGKIPFPPPQCKAAIPYFKSLHSPTLSLCIDIACQPGQTREWYNRAIYQCFALERAARRNNNGRLPVGW